MGVRDEKKGLLKYNILVITLEMMKEKAFECITVSEISHAAGISEVTFFKIFRMKEEILQYFMLVWNLKRVARLEKEDLKKGLTAIYSIFEDIAMTENSLGIMVSLVSFFSNLKKQPRPMKLATYDKRAILKNDMYSEVEVEEFESQMLRHLKEAIAAGEIDRSVDLLRTIKVIAGVFYGVPLISQMSFSNDFYGDYKDSLDLIFTALKHGRG